MPSAGGQLGAFRCGDDDFLPKGEFVLATLVYKGGDGKEKKVQTKLRERCRGMLMHGPVGVPDEAVIGPALMLVELPESSDYMSRRTALRIELK